MAAASDVVVVGGGVVGTAIAYFASSKGLSCTVLDKGRIGGGASHAASGALSSSPGSGPYARLGQRSRKLYHKLAPVIREESGVDIEFAQCGELILAFDEEDVIGLQGLTQQFTALGEKAAWVSSDDLFQLEPEPKSGHTGRNVHAGRVQGEQPASFGRACGRGFAITERRSGRASRWSALPSRTDG